jgi:hypothetical protein
MKRLLISLGAVLILTACTQGSDSVTYQLTIKSEDQEQITELIQASMRVIERRLRFIGEKLLEHNITTYEESPAIELTLTDPVGVPALTDRLQEPFSLRLMKEALEDDTAEIEVLGHGGFISTGIEEEHLIWAHAGPDTDPVKGRILLSFTDEGRVIMEEIFEENIGKFVGLFVREKLISKMLVESEALKDAIVIKDIPTVELASIFADDVNVGMYVTFTPVK